MNLSKRVIILDKLNSPHIAQAIFILKDSSTCEFSAVMEAEKIVSDYMANKEFSPKRNHLMTAIVCSLAVAGIILAIFAAL